MFPDTDTSSAFPILPHQCVVETMITKLKAQNYDTALETADF